MYLLVRVRYTAVFVQEILICCLRLLKIYGEGGWGDTNVEFTTQGYFMGDW